MLVLIAPHEFGHFLIAKLCGVKVNEFSVGMGPLLWKKQKGETQYSVRAIPIGGYCAMEGEDESSTNPRAFNNQNPLKKIAILIAGVTMNVVIAIIACSLIYQISGVPTNKLDEVTKNTPAYEAGLRSGDVIVEINGATTSSWPAVTEAISKYDGKGDISIAYSRNGKVRNIDLAPVYNEERESYTIGIVADTTKNPLLCTSYGLKLTKELNDQVFKAIGMIVSGGVHKDDIAGPVGLVRVVNDVSSAGLEPYLLLLALVSLNLALMNLLPIPGLDGGKLLFVLLKWITRNRINDDMEYKASVAGIMLLLGLFVIITINDISNIIH